MNNEEREIIQHISDTLDEVLVVLKKPDNKIMKALELAGTIVSILAIFSITEAVLKLIFGG